MVGRGHRHLPHLRQGAPLGPRRKRGAKAQGIGPSRGGQTTKIHALVDVLGRPGVLRLTPGNASDVKTAPDVLAQAPGRLRRLIADKATTETGCALICGRTASRRSSRARAAASAKSATTNFATASAGGSRPPSAASRTSAASPHATTSSPATTPQPWPSPPSSPSGADRVQTLGRELITAGTGEAWRR